MTLMRLPSAYPVPRKAHTALALAFQIALCGGALIFQLMATSNLPSAYSLSLALTMLLGWSIASWRVAGRRLFDPYCIFLASAFLFNAGHALLEVTGTNNDGILGGTFSDDIVRQTLMLSFAGLAALHLGALLIVGVTPARVGQVCWPTPERELSARQVGWILLLIAIPPAVMWLAESVTIVSASGYASLYDRDFQSGIAATPVVLSGFLVPASLFLTASGRRHVVDRRLAASIILVFAMLQLYIGYRSTAAMPLIAWMWLRHKLIKPIRWSVIVSWCVVLVFVVFPLVRETRNLSLDERSAESFWSMFASHDNPAILSIHEMGSSMGTTAHTLTLVPSVRPFDDGAGYLYAFLTLFPNIFWDLHPTIARGTATDWLVRSINPWLAARGGAYGYSCIAEAYLNFGPLGVMPMMAIYGLLLVALIRWAERSGDPARFALVATVLAFILRFPRDELQGVLRPAVWQAVVPYLCVVLVPAIMAGAVRRSPIRFRTATRPSSALVRGSSV